MFYNYNYNSICYSTPTAYATCASKGSVPVSMFSVAFPGIGTHCAFMAGYGVLNFLLLIAIEYGLANFMNHTAQSSNSNQGRSTLSLIHLSPQGTPLLN
jgi:hypothetical protein